MGSLFGGSSRTDKNVNNGLVKGLFTGPAGYTGQAGGAISSLLGLGGNSAAQTGALNNFANSAGMNFVRDQGSQAITNNQAASGLLNSGGTLKALDQYGQGLGSTYLNQYMGNLYNLANLGLGSGGLLAQTGQKSKSSQKNGIGGFLGGIASGAAAG